MQIRLASVHVGLPAPLGDRSAGVVSAIAKRVVPTDVELALSEINLAGDGQADRTVHGGVEKAVYAHPSEHLAAWAVELAQPDLSSDVVAAFGENLSTEGATETDTHIGDVWAWGSAVLQVCQPRWPCQKLTLHRASPQVGPIMRRTGRTGWYLRVLQPGQVPAAGPIEIAERHPAEVSVLDAHLAMADRHLDDRARAERVVNLGPVLAEEWRRALVDRLADSAGGS